VYDICELSGVAEFATLPLLSCKIRSCDNLNSFENITRYFFCLTLIYREEHKIAANLLKNVHFRGGGTFIDYSYQETHLAQDDLTL
jgi:hypothetical protein